MKARARIGTVLASVLALVMGLAAVAGTSGASSRPSSSGGGVVTFALPPGTTATYIFPFVSGPVSNNIDLFQFSPFMWRPLYWFGFGKSPAINYSQSIGQAPVYSNGGRTVTITLNKDYRWPNGQPVTNRDVELWMNIFKAEKQNYLAYNPGSIPDDLSSMSFPANKPEQFSLTFKKAYSHLFVLYNQLSQIIPIPQYAWDKTSANGSVGNYDLTTSGATKVYDFLNTQSKDEAAYDTNPLWKVADGPWLLSQFSPSTGYSAFVPNPTYGGPDKPKISKFEEVPFTSDTAEFDALRSGQLDYGYLPSEDIDQEGFLKSRGYTIAPWTDFGFNDFFLNYANPKVGSIFKQLYVRQAMQHLINQQQISNDIFQGTAYPDYGPVPTEPPNPYATPALAKNPYPYSVSAAKKLLSEHGWSVDPGSADTCERPGTGTSDCGAGIAKGAKLSFTELVATGSAPFLTEVEAMQSAWSLVGIQVTLREGSLGQVYSSLTPCSKSNPPGCQWEMGNFGEPGGTPTYSPEYLPTGGPWFATGAANNTDSYSNPKMDALIAATETNSSPSAVTAFGLYAAQQLPNLWQPNYYYQLSVISNKLHGALPQDPNLNLYPQEWTLSS